MKWSELTPKARESFLSTYHDTHWGSESILDFYKEDPDTKANGFDIDEIYYSGFSCQGDGASWKGRVRLKRYVEHFMTSPDDAVKREVLLAMDGNDDVSPNIYISTRGNYSHSGTMYVNAELVTYYGELTTIDAASLKDSMFYGAYTGTIFEAIGGEAMLEALCEEMLQAAKDLADEIYKALEAEYDYQHSEECVAELAEANDWEFNEEGEMI